MTIRPATVADVPALVAMGQEQLAAYYGDASADNPAQLATFLTALVTAPIAGTWVAERAGAVVGMIGLVVAPHHLTGRVTAAEVMWWVDPSARGLGLRLLRTAEDWARTQDATVLEMVAPAGGDGARAGHLYTRLGYAPLETRYTRALREEA